MIFAFSFNDYFSLLGHMQLAADDDVEIDSSFNTKAKKLGVPESMMQKTAPTAAAWNLGETAWTAAMAADEVGPANVANYIMAKLALPRESGQYYQKKTEDDAGIERWKSSRKGGFWKSGL